MQALISKYLGRALALPFLCAVIGTTACQNSAPLESVQPVLLESLSDITIQTLRDRDYGAQITVETLDTDSCIGAAKIASLPEASGTYNSFMSSFTSDGLRQYARITLPDGPPPEAGFPHVLFLHGYIGKDKAPNYSIGCNPENLYYSELTDAFARAGFAVLAPGYRGHASVNGVPAEGIEYLEAFDQGAGLSTQFYAVDSLNFAAGIQSINGEGFPSHSFTFDPDRFYLVGHSQGGDAGLTYLAATGEGRHEHLSPSHAALWSGTFLDRLTALEKMMPVGLTPEAFLSGDGSWTGTAMGKNGEVNPNFIFGYPPDWIEDPNTENWTWQKESWGEPGVISAINKVTQKMYADISENVPGYADLQYEISRQPDVEMRVTHDPRIAKAFPNIGGYNFGQYLQEPLTLHVPEKDYYSQIFWNENLCERINTSGGACEVIVYSHNNHSMRASPHLWFSPEGTLDGYPIMMQNLVTKFQSEGEKNP